MQPWSILQALKSITEKGFDAAVHHTHAAAREKHARCRTVLSHEASSRANTFAPGATRSWPKPGTTLAARPFRSCGTETRLRIEGSAKSVRPDVSERNAAAKFA